MVTLQALFHFFSLLSTLFVDVGGMRSESHSTLHAHEHPQQPSHRSCKGSCEVSRSSL
jgi:hypothetical protein